MKPRPRRKANSRHRLDIRDVAAHAGVSIATVSRTINGVASVDKELARRVWKSIRELDYFPNTQARALVSGRSRILGLLVSEITNPFFPELIQGFEDIATSHGYEILIGSTSYDPDRIKRCVRRMLERNVDGAAIMTFGLEEPVREQLVQQLSNIPIIFVDDAPAAARAFALTIDYHHGIREGVQHLAALGHRKIAFISGPLVQRSAQLRKAAFLQSADEIGCIPPPHWLLEGSHTLEGGMQAMESMLARRTLPTAVMCSNDMTAIGVLRVLAGAGIEVPKKISIIGFDDIQLAEYVYPPLTTIRMSRNGLARAAVEALRTQIEAPEKPLLKTLLNVTTNLAVRRSTGCVPRASSSRRTTGVSAAAGVEERHGS
jgi:DNA-binding LacI/PurR family transcriptional regulator